MLPVVNFSLLPGGPGATAEGEVPPDAEFFKDHFPDFPVLPGVLALEILRKVVERFFENQSDETGKRARIKGVRGVKFSHYLKPGDRWICRVERLGGGTVGLEWKGELRNGRGETAASARFIFDG
jgi:3-hydroxyacyl-[acyl-carrier-protein] dehydratase